MLMLISETLEFEPKSSNKNRHKKGSKERNNGVHFLLLFVVVGVGREIFSFVVVVVVDVGGLFGIFVLEHSSEREGLEGIAIALIEFIVEFDPNFLNNY